MGWQLGKTVVMVGMMGAGKTAIGTALARALDVPFLDSDEEIVKAANMSIAEIFERDGEPFFRRKESQVIERLLETERCVLSTGGGAFLSPENRQMISEKGVSVWLRADLDGPGIQPCPDRGMWAATPRPIGSCTKAPVARAGCPPVHGGSGARCSPRHWSPTGFWAGRSRPRTKGRPHSHPARPAASP